MIDLRYEATLIVRLDKKTGEEISSHITNIRPARTSLDNYLAPAIEYLAALFSENQQRAG